ncbi:4-oxalomesaconate tautomerase [Sneathiella marina]|uniref:4-oxalomesaconate tautomerase n=1 Tax=Sneathiella marina TaxID=2950108 RepID=A0ABY4WC54_9PROT|nr:4-oxalomesaconate tautomerase [Sneathiella marina]USG62231.1 4-oxalomesaconate tautomerase [Sneathiella marina]
MFSAPCMWMRGGTSKGGYFLESDLPEHPGERDNFLMGIMGSPDPRQIDGMGGADPLTSKIAIVKPSSNPNADVDYLFLQIAVDLPQVSSAQNCGNLLAGVGPFAIERGLVPAAKGTTEIRIFMENTGQTAVVKINTPDGSVNYKGKAEIDGVPGNAAAIPITFTDTAGSSCGALLPSGNIIDTIDDVEVTLIDNGMPSVILRACDMGVSGNESREELDANTALKQRLENIRLQVGPIMKLGDVANKTVPKMCMVSAPKHGGAISTRTFIPHRCHASIGVLGAVTVATACAMNGSVATDLAIIPPGPNKELEIEHPIGRTAVMLDMNDDGNIDSAAIIRTARKLFDGTVYAP